MIDFHNHIIPSVDDGSKSIEESIEMLKYAHSIGIKEVVSTIHLGHPTINNHHIEYVEILEKKRNLENILEKENIDLKIYLAAEVYMNPNILDYLDHEYALIGNKKYMLIEFPVIAFPPKYEDLLFKLILKGVTPIIAHPERYRTIQQDFIEIKKFINLGCLVQIDSGSLLGLFGKNALDTSINLIKSGFCHLLGSDAHNSKKRNFCLNEGLEVAKDLIGATASFMVREHPENIIKGKKINIDNYMNKIIKNKENHNNWFKRIFK